MGSERDDKDKPGVLPARSPVRGRKIDKQSGGPRGDGGAAERRAKEDISRKATREAIEREAIRDLDTRSRAAKERLENQSFVDALMNPFTRIDATMGNWNRDQVAEKIRRGGEIVRAVDTGKVVGVVEKGGGIFGQDTYTGASNYNPIAFGRKNRGVKLDKLRGYVTSSIDMNAVRDGGARTISDVNTATSTQPSASPGTTTQLSAGARRSARAQSAAGAARRSFFSRNF